jgi:chromate transporter
MRDNVYLTLIAILAPLSLASIGGATSIYAPLQHQTVDTLHWLTPREYLDLFAIARMAPGPSSMLAALIGWKVAGIAGAAIATVAIYLPSSLLCYAIARVWHQHRGKPWHRACEAGLTPVAAGLVLAGALTLLRLAGTTVLAWVTVAVVAALLTWRPKLHPLILLACGAAAFPLTRLVWR